MEDMRPYADRDAVGVKTKKNTYRYKIGDMTSYTHWTRTGHSLDIHWTLMCGIFFYMFFEGLGIEKMRFLRRPTFNNWTKLQWFLLLFTFSKNLYLYQFWFILVSILAPFWGFWRLGSDVWRFFANKIQQQKHNKKIAPKKSRRVMQDHAWAGPVVP